MVDNEVESVKIIGPREMNVDIHSKRLMDQSDFWYRIKPFFNDAKESFRICYSLISYKLTG